MQFYVMRLSTSIKLVIVLWLIAEVLAFALVADLIGAAEAVLLTFVTSLFGWTLLKRTGKAVKLKLRAALNGRRLVEGETHRFVDETLAGIGAVALLIPGFLSDIAGLVLAVPAARDRIATWLERNGRAARWQRGDRPRHGPATIDLDRTEWQQKDISRQTSPKA